MFCTRCGRAVPEGARFCPNCGAAVTVVSAPAPESAEPIATPPSPYAPPAEPIAAPASPYAPPAEPLAPIAAEPVAATAWAPPAFEPQASAPPAATPPYGPPSFSPYAGAGATEPASTLVYAGFWRRFWAAFLDGILLNILLSPLYLTWVWPAMVGHADPENMDPQTAFALMGTMMSYVCVGTLIEMLYYAVLESSSYQATLGKLALGIRVTDLDGRRVSFARALGRRLARIVTNLTLLIGYLMNLWTRRRQTLHDLMSGTLVVRRPETPR